MILLDGSWFNIFQSKQESRMLLLLLLLMYAVAVVHGKSSHIREDAQAFKVGSQYNYALEGSVIIEHNAFDIKAQVRHIEFIS